MPRSALYAVIIALVFVVGAGSYYAYQEYQRKQNSTEITIGPNGIKIDPPAR
ncbi:hypothetical protein [Xanthobacter sp. VNH20]|uniref:hypothetical protein n=1 Tax=Xanthobacter sp. VNH20 TaxID=3156616 RepID=UPI0032B3A83C